MHKRSLFFFFAIGLLLGCQKTTRTEPLSLPPSPLPSLFGPIVTPVDGFFRTLAITYQTPSPEKTSLTFTMTGNIDWYLERSAISRTHQVLFEDVEEEATYTFLPQSFPSNHMTTIITSPITKTKSISFAVIQLQSQWKETSYPDFTILVSHSSPSEDEFRQFYQANTPLVHNSILCPTFRTTIEHTPLGEEKNWYWFAYGKVLVIVLKHHLPAEALYLYLLPKPDNENFIIAVDFDEKEWQKLLIYQEVAHLIPFSSHTESLTITVSSNITTFYSYKK